MTDSVADARPSGPLRRLLHALFEASLAIKAVLASLEGLSGLALLLIGGGPILSGVHWLTIHEITEDPGDPLARWLQHAADGLSLQTEHFFALYLMGHGALKLLMVAGLWSQIRWTYPASMALLLALVVYEMHGYLTGGGIGLLILAGFDTIMIGLVWSEFRALERAAT